MIKLICEKCGSVWYTANTDEKQLCDKCGAELKFVTSNMHEEYKKDNSPYEDERAIAI